ncbi:MAG: argininosuccinate lyase, partial [Candidatus Latescibacteria bacterium]|nr:argininosuccinate lyase [Candidatus Latescibacterota bacterium]
MTKLWEKGYQLDQQMERFTVGDDYLLDRRLVRADVLGSIAHAKMLSTIRIFTVEEFSKLKKCLLEILSQAEKGEFEIRPEDEDVHTAVENA